VTVTDSGVGFDVERMNKLFDAFYATFSFSIPSWTIDTKV
jgi:hypothetical protein